MASGTLLATEVLLEVRQEMAPWIDLQVVATSAPRLSTVTLGEQSSGVDFRLASQSE